MQTKTVDVERGYYRKPKEAEGHSIKSYYCECGCKKSYYRYVKDPEKKKRTKKCNHDIEPLPLILVPADKLKAGEVFLWRSGFTGKYEMHSFHSDMGYGVKTFTDYDEKNGSSLIVNYSGICGKIKCVKQK